MNPYRVEAVIALSAITRMGGVDYEGHEMLCDPCAKGKIVIAGEE